MFKIYKDKAAKIGVEIKKSTNPKKKFDAYKNGEKQNSFGAASYMDYEKKKIKAYNLLMKKGIIIEQDTKTI
jgi:hypothetical protein